MKTYDEIYDIIYNRLGLRDQASYKAYIDEFHREKDPRIPTQEELDLLSPELINNRDFWLVAERIFATDPVANCQYADPLTIEQANCLNLRIYHSYGFSGMMANLAGVIPNATILEIGPGYGAFKQWLSRNSAFSYHAADVYPRIGGVDQNEPTGLLSDETKARRYNAVIASNVFQHLSTFQRRRYYEDIAGCLAPNGLFMVSMALDAYRWDHPAKDSQGRFWCKHYGQFTEIQREADILADLKRHFLIVGKLIMGTGYSDHEIVLTCQKKPESIVAEVPNTQ